MKTGIACLLALCSVSRTAGADVEGCRATQSLIILPKGDPDDTVFVAWNFKGARNVDYARVLRDDDYSQGLFDAHEARIRNYLVDERGRILAELPLEAGAGFFRAAGFSPNHREYFFAQDKKHGFVMYGFGWKWNTAGIFLYKVNGSGASVSLARINGVALGDIQRAYAQHLDHEFGSDYRAAKPRLTMQFGLISLGDTPCQGGDFCFTLSADAYVPKAEAGFTNESELHFVVKLQGSDKGLLRLDRVRARPH